MSLLGYGYGGIIDKLRAEEFARLGGKLALLLSFAAVVVLLGSPVFQKLFLLLLLLLLRPYVTSTRHP